MASTDKEIWKQIPYLKGVTEKNYAVSNKGRIASYEGNIHDLTILKPKMYDGMYRYNLRHNGKVLGLFPSVAVATVFIKKPNSKCTKIIHLNYDKTNNIISNLKWVTSEEYFAHRAKNTHSTAALLAKVAVKNMSKKLDEKKVVQLKKEIWNPKRKVSLKQLADKYGIAEMNLYRIKSGVFWYHIRVEGEPLHDSHKLYLKNLELYNKQLAKDEAQKAKLAAEKKAQKQKIEERRKRLAAEKKSRQAASLKRKKEKAIERIAIEKRKAQRAKAAEKRLLEKAKKTKPTAKKIKTKKNESKNYTLVKITRKAKKSK
jgi:DNA-binding Xre family transcriptional regulator